MAWLDCWVDMCNVLEMLATKRAELPPKPKSTVTIDGPGVQQLLLPYGITLSGGPGDSLYKLPSRQEAINLIDYYKKHAPFKPWDYTNDDFDCEDFAWVFRAKWIVWTDGEYLCGYVEGWGTLPDHTFPNHGWNFIILDTLEVYYFDHLGVATPKMAPAFKINSTMGKA